MSYFIRKQIFGIYVDDVKLTNLPKIIIDLIKTQKKSTFFGINPHSINHALRSPSYKKILQSATLAYPEGIGTIIAAQILGAKLSQKTNLLDFMFPVLKLSEQKGLALFLLGGTEDANKKTFNMLKKSFPHLKLAGRYNGFFGKNDREVIETINQSKPDILFVALGSPMQELWIHENLQKVKAKAFFGIGGSIDILAGNLPRAPWLVRLMGLDWFFRLLLEPKRLWKRYIIGNFLFANLLICEHFSLNTYRKFLLKLPEDYY